MLAYDKWFITQYQDKALGPNCLAQTTWPSGVNPDIIP